MTATPSSPRPTLYPVRFASVAATLYRSSQPSGAQWQTIKDRGVTTIVKLNDPSEGSDAEASALGLRVLDLAIPPAEGGSLVAEVQGLFQKPDPAKLLTALQACKAGKVLVHCTHGQDRTGLVVGLYRVHVQGWPRHRAWSEMLQYGYHPELVGLDRAWFEQASFPELQAPAAVVPGLRGRPPARQ